jgi:hypothetical protein
VNACGSDDTHLSSRIYLLVRGFDSLSQRLWDNHNRGKQWADIRDKVRYIDLTRMICCEVHRLIYIRRLSISSRSLQRAVAMSRMSTLAYIVSTTEIYIQKFASEVKMI